MNNELEYCSKIEKKYRNRLDLFKNKLGLFIKKHDRLIPTLIIITIGVICFLVVKVIATSFYDEIFCEEVINNVSKGTTITIFSILSTCCVLLILVLLGIYPRHSKTISFYQYFPLNEYDWEKLGIIPKSKEDIIKGLAILITNFGIKSEDVLNLDFRILYGEYKRALYYFIFTPQQCIDFKFNDKTLRGYIYVSMKAFLNDIEVECKKIENDNKN